MVAYVVQANHLALHGVENELLERSFKLGSL